MIDPSYEQDPSTTPKVIEPEPALTLEEAKQKFRHALEATSSNNTLAVRDRRYFDGDQLDSSTRAELKKRGQPAFINNKIAPSISGILGVIDAGDSDPEALARNASGQDAADVATKVMRKIADTSNLAEVLNGVSKDFIIEGSGAAIIEGGPDHVEVHHIPWDDFFFDPQARRYDFKDARYLGFAKWMDADQVESLYPDKFPGFGNVFSDDFTLDAKEVDSRKLWVDTSRKQMRVVSLYHEDGNGQWHHCVFCRAGYLDYGPSEYVNDGGESVCPIEAASYEITRDNDRYGAVRNMVPLQDKINAYESRMLHLINHRQVKQVDLNAPEQNAAIVKREAVKADGAIPFGWDLLPTGDMAQGNHLLLQNAKADMDRLAPTPAVLGQMSGSNQSGRSRQILQEAGYTEMARAIGRYESLEERIYKQMWFRARQFYESPDWVRATSDPRTPEFIQINEPVVGPPIPQLVEGEDGQPQVQLVPQVTYKNRLAEMDVDIIVTRVPNTVSLQQETFAEVIKLAQSTQMRPFEPEFLALLEISGLPNARSLVEKMEKRKSLMDQQAAAQAELAAQAAQLQAQTQQAKAAKDMAGAEKASAEAQSIKLETLAQAYQHGLNTPPI